MRNKKILYHASSICGLKLLKPQKSSYRDSREPAFIFAAPTKAIASTFLFVWNDDWIEMGILKKKPYIVISDSKRFKRVDKGGSIYAVPKSSFRADSKKGLGLGEWVATKNIIPINEERYASALLAMIENGVKVYFVDKKTFQKIRNADDYGISIIKKFVPEMRSLKNASK